MINAITTKTVNSDPKTIVFDCCNEPLHDVDVDIDIRNQDLEIWYFCRNCNKVEKVFDYLY